ncbi:TonB-dependent receptor [Paraburkholderia edwinii]|uniref:TonB-dependent receptor n=1 Tax=Paraburkholderia edwinii TaxID=2861782 RepID=A0ABX8UFG5_9BURK|nr:TonB-dependent receptor [Paraburkholderia edwinii]QYD67581.1 TonB-dependent receptor [Paraburkholderia edwinii]
MKSRTHIAQAAVLLFTAFAGSQTWAADAATNGATRAATTLSGTVEDANGKPIANAQVSLKTSSGGDAGHANTDAKGQFELNDVAPGAYAVAVTATGFEATTKLADTTNGTAAPLALKLKKDDTLDVNVYAKRLDQARNGLSPETGSSIYRITNADIQAMPLGENTPLNQVLLQAPGVANDSFGQVHVRGDHADLQYRINGIQIPEPISGFGQSLDTRIIDQVNLLTGALPAQYGNRTAGIVDIHTKNGDAGDGGSIDVFGGSHQTLRTSADVYGSKGDFSYFFTGSLGVNNLGIEAPTASPSPIHDHTRQGDAFGYMSYLINPLTRVSVMLGTAANQFEIPNTPGLPQVFTLAGTPTFNSANLNETQSELNNFAVVALQGTNGGDFDYQVALSTRYTRTQFNPDPVGDLIFNGVASNDFHNDTANSLQADTTWRLNSKHTLRGGIQLTQEHAQFSDTVSVFPTDADGNQASDVPMTLQDSSSKTGYLYSAYLQDEWKITQKLTLNYGLRYDGMNEFVTAHQLSPRIGAVYQLTPATTVHAGYARYFTPPSFELVSSGTIGRFAGTTNAPEVTQNDPVQPERDDYYDVGVTQRLGSDVTIGLDAYYKKAHNLLDEGQFGTALIFAPFNYQYGRVYGVEFTANYKHENISAYLNVAYSRAQGKNIDSAQFNFGADELAFISNHFVFLDHDQRVTASFGGSYTWHTTTFTADGTVGSGLRSGFANTEKLPLYAQINLGVIEHINAPLVGKVDVRGAVVNAFGRVYELRDGSGIGVGAPQFGPYRAFYAGVTKYF